MITFIIQYILSPVILAFTGYMTWLLQHNKRTGDANATGTMLLLRREIIEDHRRFILDGEPMSADEFAYINEVYNAYKGLNGNGMADKLYAELEKKETGVTK